MRERLLALKAAIAVAIGTMGEFLGWKGVMVVVLALCMAMDYLSGTLAARKNGEWSSTIAREGLYNKGGTILIVGAAAVVDFVFYFLIPTLPILGRDLRNPGVFLPLVLAWYIITEIGSILENASKMGAAVPKWFLKAVSATKKGVDKTGEANVPVMDDNGEANNDNG